MPNLTTLRAKINEYWTLVQAKIPPQFLTYWQRFYAKKIFFWPVTIVFSMLLLTIILGLLFGGRKNAPIYYLKTQPTPTSFNEVKPTPVNDSLSQFDQKLTNLKAQIDGLDVKESKLAPPTLDFKISFL